MPWIGALSPPARPYEPTVGLSRAVRVGRHVFVAGTCAGHPDGGAPPADAYGQARRCLEIIVAALGEPGLHAEHVVVRAPSSWTRADWDDVGARPRRGFRRDPAREHVSSSSALLDPPWLVEIEADAVRRVNEQQIYPPSITGKGAGFATGGSVLDHAFGQSDPYTLGVEEEYMLLDGRDVRPRAAHRHGARGGRRTRARAARSTPELMQSVLEIATPVCHTPAEVARAAAAASAVTSAAIAREQGMRVGSAGTHPVQPLRAPAHHCTRPLPRARRPDAVRRAPRADLRHAHPRRRGRRGEGDPDRERPRSRTSGRCWRCPRARRSGAASRPGSRSSRQMVFAAFPRSGPPPRFENYADYAEVVGQLEKTGCIADYTHIWWDIRLHPRLGTIEIRICDAVTRLEHVVAIVGVLPGAREALLRALRRAARRSRRTTASSRRRTSGSPAATGSRRR